MMFRDDLFAERTVLITGGTSGIGSASALLFAELGARVHALGLGACGPEAPHHERITVYEQDVTETESMAALVDSFAELDVLVNCAGLSRDRAEYEAEHWDHVLSVNLTAAMRTANRAHAALAARGGNIVQIASMYAYIGAGDRPAYGASKGAITSLTRALAVDYARDGIRVNAVAPGWIETPLSAGLRADPEAEQAVRSRIPARHWGNPREVAKAIAFLAAPESTYITGTVLPVDGGFLAA